MTSSALMDSRTTVGRRYYRPELDVVRFIAFFLVFLLHNLPGHRSFPHSLRGLGLLYNTTDNACRFGLSLFFTLSAFLICELLLRERESTGTVAIGQFYVRRMLRIWPLYYLALIISAGFALAPGGNPREIVTDMSWYLIFMGAWQFAIHGGLKNPMFMIWSVSVEEQFYLFAPWLLKLCSRKGLYAASAVLFVLSNLWGYHLGAHHAETQRVWGDSLVQFQCFGAGILLCLILRGRAPQISGWIRSLLLAGSAVCWGVASRMLDFGSGTGSWSCWSIVSGFPLASLGSVLVILALLGMSAGRLPGWAVYLGRISYGLYVYHGLARYLVRRVAPFLGRHANTSLPIMFAGLALTILMAALSYRYFEAPFLKLKRRHEMIESRPV